MSDFLIAQLENAEFIEGIEYWSVGLYESPDMTVTKNLGVQNVWIAKYTTEIENAVKEVFAIKLETVAEIVNLSKGEAKVLDEIYENPRYETGAFEVVEVFESYIAAYDYANKHYPKVELEQLIKARFAS